ncbi:hypothetical protein HYPSUDRAFT_210263 [Hypholoma sublateritium FD-334 SS-4]|uniref:Uncharacterized protein n=1 Tax=Hypholoma sublateritium (strain FD-334 SS-4) TaxID=945553 RepID=A0A0D2LPE9_HYPSF|nr:hypothetical protein HYPSUDRAFT_210263 [Hypholoma sublateritium FD-334 SS-4]
MTDTDLIQMALHGICCRCISPHLPASAADAWYNLAVALHAWVTKVLATVDTHRRKRRREKHDEEDQTITAFASVSPALVPAPSSSSSIQRVPPASSPPPGPSTLHPTPHHQTPTQSPSRQASYSAAHSPSSASPSPPQAPPQKHTYPPPPPRTHARCPSIFSHTLLNPHIPHTHPPFHPTSPPRLHPTSHPRPAYYRANAHHQQTAAQTPPSSPSPLSSYSIPRPTAFPRPRAEEQSLSSRYRPRAAENARDVLKRHAVPLQPQIAMSPQHRTPQTQSPKLHQNPKHQQKTPHASVIARSLLRFFPSNAVPGVWLINTADEQSSAN